MTANTHSAGQIEATFREEHGRILAALISQLGDFRWLKTLCKMRWLLRWNAGKPKALRATPARGC